ncbi:TIM barrel protein [Variovorax sp. J22P168]|uniref:sugar phosphate isomerase/epimerase family protein n=1 Tax=Variovorax jilinensis TaxID=3053513 RepID=UPI002578A470|nr:TIM barrel protein [Variovorax sp. J22P168]MDM0014831.1 TIM barrel protein [Variovorax sp. J22P168]
MTSGASKPRAAHPLCLAHLTLIELAPPELVEVAADAGFDRVSMRLAPASAGEHQHPMIGDTPMMREALARMRDRGVAVHDVELVRLTDHTSIAELEPLLAAAAMLGAQHMLVAGDSDDEAALAQRFGELCALGARYGLTMALEFMPWRGIRSLASARRVLEAAGSGGVVVDAIHLARSGGTADDLARLPLHLWAYFQICDAPAQPPSSADELLFQARRARLPPGQGGLDLVAMLRALPPATVVSIEVPLHGRPDLLPPVPRARMLRDATLDLLAQAHASR